MNYPATLDIPPGGQISIGIDGDFHGDAGHVRGSALIGTDDPGARIIQVPVHAYVTKTTDVRPYRDLVCAQRGQDGNLVSGSVRYAFFPAPGGKPFTKVWVEDPEAPLVLAQHSEATGVMRGTVSIDLTRIPPSSPKTGVTRILGVTETGQANYCFIQWRIQD